MELFKKHLIDHAQKSNIKHYFLKIWIDTLILTDLT